MSTFDARAEALKFAETGFLGSAAEWRENLVREFQRVLEAGRTEGRDEGLRMAGELAKGPPVAMANHETCDHGACCVVRGRIIAAIERERTGAGR